jgi:hypothetical protein
MSPCECFLLALSTYRWELGPFALAEEMEMEEEKQISIVR